jgi:hypothetical protein
MMMGSTGVVRPILPKSVVANLRHQSIININKRLKQKIQRLHDKILTPMELKYIYVVSRAYGL